MSDEDIRSLLGRAFDNEPPIRFERAHVMETGRRLLRRRRLFAAGGAVATVAAVSAGIMLAAGFHGSAEIPVIPGSGGSCEMYLVPTPRASAVSMTCGCDRPPSAINGPMYPIQPDRICSYMPSSGEIPPMRMTV